MRRVATDPLAVRAAALSPPRPRRVIHLFMAGAPSQLDLFDYKPKLTELEGKPIPPSVIGGQRYAFIRPDAAVLGPRFKFAKHGQCGAELSEMLPHLAEGRRRHLPSCDRCTPISSTTPRRRSSSTPASRSPAGRASARGSLYGLGAETDDLPAFVVMSTGAGISGGAANWSSGFLPTVYTGVRFRNSGRSDPQRLQARRASTRSCSATRSTWCSRSIASGWPPIGDPEIATRIASYEMAFRLQTSAPELMDLKSESKETLDLYGCDPAKPSFARACLLARRMVERGVRFVNIYHEGWDAHSDVAGNCKNNCGATDQGVRRARQGPEAARPARRHAGHLGRRIRPHADGRNQRRRWAAAWAATIIRRPSPCGWPAAASSRA